jgi:asparagine synthetase B (glutamine-hydrolysing)
MCSIIGSFDKKTLKKLVKLNQFRGSFSHSLTIYNTTTGTIKSQIKNFGEFPVKLLDMITLEKDDYIIGHVQAPTGGMVLDKDRIHPVELGNSQLWHNGLLTSRGITHLQKELLTDETFDTKLLHTSLKVIGLKALNDIEGMFASVYVANNEMFIFRSKHAKLYIDKDMNISSESFVGVNIPADTVYAVDLKEKKLSEVWKFKTKRFNVVIPDGDISAFIK